MKRLFIMLFLLAGIEASKAQDQFLSGTYSSTFGNITLVEESNEANPSKKEKIIYGDYRNLGSILSTSYEIPTGIYVGGANRKIKGVFMNGTNPGSFQWVFTPGPNIQNPQIKFEGIWGWGSQLNGGEWKGSRESNKSDINLKFAQWSGNWMTSYGMIFLKQHGHSVSGDYGTKGQIQGTVQGNKLTGTFTNGNTKGSFEFILNGNVFSGKWGWGKNLDQGNWKGTKKVKTNTASAAGLSEINATVTQNIQYRLTLDKIIVRSSEDGISRTFSGYELFGIAWCRAYDLNGKQLSPLDVRYTDSYGRFWEIKPQNHLSDMRLGDHFTIGKSITFEFPVGSGNSLGTILSKSTFELTVELKDYDRTSSNDILGKERITFTIDEGNFSPLTDSRLPAPTGPGILNIRHGKKGQIQVTYYLERIK
ncbi:hypothetical protein [Algoriphagus sp. PAP.12]|uniref:hypothetical protein n=1 Tax=Algoriphagus sp. PAP.12 TaxID=2996678 RepID=UPI00227BD849|nr:hypothetical protein [Algoriphagus sp. PAP.12]